MNLCKTLIILLISLLPLLQSAQNPVVGSGSVTRFENFPSKYVTSRNIDVWLPDGYSPRKRYAVFYMHDGQMLFDSTINWNKTEWCVDETMSAMMAQKKIGNCIVVGIWNGGATRHSDYFPQKPFEKLTPEQKEFITKDLIKTGRTDSTFRPVSDNYLKFLVYELKPFIDSHFSTKTDKSYTFIAGSSMGGLISIYAICEYPDIFGGAACLSTHWPGIFTNTGNPFPASMNNYLEKNLPSPGKHRIYFDYGTATLDSLYPPLQTEVDKIMKEKGFTPAKWTTRKFEGADHSERAWSKRLSIPIIFLSGKHRNH